MSTTLPNPETSTALKTLDIILPDIAHEVRQRYRDLRRGKIVVEQPSMMNTVGHLFGCRHDWSFPHTSPSLKSQYPPGFDSHRTCTRCGSKQLYSFADNRSGPYFTETV